MSDSSESESGALAPRRPVSPRKLKRQRLPARGSDSGALARDLGVPPSGVGSSKGPGTRPVQTELSKTRARGVLGQRPRERLQRALRAGGAQGRRVGLGGG